MVCESDFAINKIILEDFCAGVDDRNTYVLKEF